MAPFSSRRNSLNVIPYAGIGGQKQAPPAGLPSVPSVDTLLTSLSQSQSTSAVNRLMLNSSNNLVYYNSYSATPPFIPHFSAYSTRYSSFSTSLENASSAASESECSEHPTDVSGSKAHQERTKKKKRKTLDRFPKLIVLNTEYPVVECQLETIDHTTVTFRFDINNDSPSDVTTNLVSQSTL